MIALGVVGLSANALLALLGIYELSIRRVNASMFVSIAVELLLPIGFAVSQFRDRSEAASTTFDKPLFPAQKSPITVLLLPNTGSSPDASGPKPELASTIT